MSPSAPRPGWCQKTGDTIKKHREATNTTTTTNTNNNNDNNNDDNDDNIHNGQYDNTHTDNNNNNDTEAPGGVHPGGDGEDRRLLISLVYFVMSIY